MRSFYTKRKTWVAAFSGILFLTPAVCKAQTNPFNPKPEVQALLDNAIKERNSARYDAALKTFTDAGSKAHALADPVGEANARLGAGNTYYLMQQYPAALAAFQEAIAIKERIGDRAGVARALVNLGNTYQSSGDSQKSQEAYEKALPVLKQFDEKRDQARALNGLGVLFRDGGDLPHALSTFEESLAIAHALNDDGAIAEVSNSIGGVYQKQNQPQKAQEKYTEALTIFHRIGNRFGEAEALNNLGGVYGLLGKPQQALATFTQLLPLFRELKNTRGEAATQANIAGIAAETGDPEKARVTYDTALNLYRSIPDPKGEANLLDRIGGFYRATGSPRKALSLYDQALALYNKANDTAGAANTKVHEGDAFLDVNDFQNAQQQYDSALTVFVKENNQLGQAAALTGKAGTYSLVGDLSKSLNFYQQALPLTKGSRFEAPAYMNLGSAFLGLGDAGTALTSYKEALRLYQLQSDTRGSAAAQVSIGDTYRFASQPKEAIPYYELSLPVFKERQDKRGTAVTLRNLGAAYAYTGDFGKAVADFEEALPLFQAVKDRLDEAVTLGNLGNLNLLLDNSEKAQTYFSPSLTICREIGNRRGEANALIGLSQVEEVKGNLAGADTELKNGLDVLESIREGIGSSAESKLTFLASTIEPFERYVHLQLAQNKNAAAFAAAQKTKARALLDLMENGHVKIAGSLTTQEREQEQLLRKQTDNLNQQMLREAVLNEEGAKERFAAYKQNLIKAESDLSTYYDTLYANHPELSRKRMAKTLTLDDMQAIIPENTALLEYVVLEAGQGRFAVDETALLVITTTQGKANVTAYPLHIKAAELAKVTEEFRTACTDYRKPYRSQAQQLYKLLIAPALPALTGKSRLIIAPSGVLWDVPFAALVDENNKFLIASREIDYTYSGTTVQSAVSLRDDTARSKPTGSIFVVANPEFGDGSRFAPLNRGIKERDERGIEMVSRALPAPQRGIEMVSRGIEMVSRGIEMVSREGRVVPLPGTQAEADALKKDFPTATVYTQKDAQESKVKAEAGNYKYIHLASHAFLNGGSPMLSSVILANPPVASTEDGLLTAREIFDMSLTADMVVLSACNTARGEKRNGEGVIGLVWSLFVAGAPTQVLSQWAVNDATTATLMEKFYSGIVANSDKGTALRNAALALSQDKEHEHPYFWAPFVLFGDWRK